MLKLVKDLGTRPDGKNTRRWCLAECSFCGSITERRTQTLKTAQSCGCATHLKAQTKHGMSTTKQYQIWADLKDRCNNETYKYIANELSKITGSTKKFCDFIIDYFKPSGKFSDIYAINWEIEVFKKSLKTIYNHRSKKLHSGISFPSLICKPPEQLKGNYLVKPFSNSYIIDGIKWDSKDIPMYLHTFEYIVRNTLLNWWESLY